MSVTAPSTPTVSRPAGRRVGYVVSVVIDVLVLWLVNVSPGWEAIPWLTGGFAGLLWLVNLSFALNLLFNVAYVINDATWFRAIGDFVLAAVSLVVSARLLAVFPFDFSAYSFDWATLARVVLWVGVLGSIIAMIAAAARLLRGSVVSRDDPLHS
jgi:hypothetical protein